ncbi:hypothetical protein BD413DRAFT_443102, partial [Trametes elegans]
ANGIDGLAADVAAHSEHVGVVEGALRVALERLALAEGRIEALADNTRGIGAASAPPEKLNQKQKNALQAAVRVCLRAFMEITDSEALPQPLANGDFWEATTMVNPRTGEELPSRRLRPRWDSSWADNEEAWLLDIMHRIRVDSKEYTSHDFGLATHEHMKNAIESVFKGFLKKWASQNASEAKKQAKMLLAKKNQRKM